MNAAYSAITVNYTILHSCTYNAVKELIKTAIFYYTLSNVGALEYNTVYHKILWGKTLVNRLF